MTDARSQFQQKVQQAIADPALQIALDNNAQRRKLGREKAFASLDEDLQWLRNRARQVRQDVVHNLDNYLRQFVERCRDNGIQVHFARDAADARVKVLEIARQHDAQLIAKSKSMVSEEIHLNSALQEQGIEVVETDLGEYIVQLRDEPPSHILTPAVHLNRSQVAATFHEKFSMPLTDDIRIMNDEARKQLREVFINADIGISGVNFGVAETGTICLVTNEGNGRMVTTVPHVHIALMGIERLVPTLADLSLMLKLLPRSATGQKITSYVSLIHTPRQHSDPDGPQERHIILVDNHRRDLLGSPLEEALNCIRCGACLNACPVFQEIGGHAYSSIYPGPIGSLISPALFGLPEYGHLAKASSLCGACMDACPVKIDFPTLLLRTRDAYVREVNQPAYLRWGMRLYTRMTVNPRYYALAQKVLQLASSLVPHTAGWLRRLPPPLNRWTSSRHFPALPSSTFRQSWERNKIDSIAQTTYQTASASMSIEPEAGSPEKLKTSSKGSQVDRLIAELNAIDAEVHRGSQTEIAELVFEKLQALNARTLLVDEDPIHEDFPQLVQRISDQQMTILSTRLMLKNHARREGIHWLSQADVGITGTVAAIAETGTLVIASGPQKSQLASLLPPVHLAILRPEDIYPTMDDWIRVTEAVLPGHQALALISGPSRTADIEMTLTIGVHGPRQLIVYIIDA